MSFLWQIWDALYTDLIWFYLGRDLHVQVWREIQTGVYCDCIPNPYLDAENSIYPITSIIT